MVLFQCSNLLFSLRIGDGMTVKTIVINRTGTKAQIIRKTGQYADSIISSNYYNLTDKQSQRLFDAVYPLVMEVLPYGSTRYKTDNKRVR